MTAGSPEPRVLVLGLGNLLLGDDAAGLRLLELLSGEGSRPGVEFIDGGTQGLALMGYLENRAGVLILDAVGMGAPPGSVHVLRGEELAGWRARAPGSAHEGNALALLETMRLLDTAPPAVVVVGIEPEILRTGIGLSDAVERALPEAIAKAKSALEGMMSQQSS